MGFAQYRFAHVSVNWIVGVDCLVVFGVFSLFWANVALGLWVVWFVALGC